MKPRRLLAAVLALLTQLSATAFAQSDADKATARELAKEGSDALEKKDFKLAADRFERADSIFHAPTLRLGLARAQVGLGKLVAAQENYYDILRETLQPNAPEAFVQSVNDAKKDLQVLGPQVPWVIVKVAGAPALKDVSLTIDGEAVPTAAIGVKRAVDPGEHTIRATAKGFRPAEKAFTIAASVTDTVEIALVPAPPEVKKKEPVKAPPEEPWGGLFPRQDMVGISAISVGGASAVVGVVTGVLALSKRSELKAAGCTDSGCPASVTASGDLDSYRTLANISTGTLIGAGVEVAVGIVLLATTPSAPKSAPKSSVRVTPFVGVGHIGVTGSF